MAKYVKLENKICRECDYFFGDKEENKCYCTASGNKTPLKAISKECYYDENYNVTAAYEYAVVPECCIKASIIELEED